MRVALISRDFSLVAVCRDIAQQISPKCDILITQEISYKEADLRIWDLDTVPNPPPNDIFFPELRHLFLVRRKQLASFLEQFPFAAGNCLLKPLNSVALRTFLEHAQARLNAVRPNGDTIRESQNILLQCLLDACLRLQAYDQDRTNMWARVAHDLRAPLMAANGYCGYLLDGSGVLTRKQQELVERIQQSLAKLNRMATSMYDLTVSRLTEQKPVLEQGDLRRCIELSVNEVLPQASEAKVSVDWNFADPDAPLYFEPCQISQVLVNLLENACKFTPSGGWIRVSGYPVPWPAADSARNGGSTRGGNGGVRVDVADSGLGIAQEHLHQVFEEYASFDGASHRSGAGLGLAIARLIIQSHGGSIWAESGGSGTTLSFVLPYRNFNGAAAVGGSGHASPQSRSSAKQSGAE